MGLENTNLEGSNNNGTPPPNQAPRDPKYYFEDGNRVFLVDGVLFKVSFTSRIK
jgi:hypothetical protein